MSDDKIKAFPGCKVPAEQPGLSPVFQEKISQFVEDLDKAVDQAAEAGIPLQFLVGILETLKYDLMEEMKLIVIERGLT